MLFSSPNKKMGTVVMLVPALPLALSLGACVSDVDSPKRLQILDACVYDQFLVSMASNGIVKRCQCAADRAMTTIDDQEIAPYQIGHAPTGELQDKIQAAVARCR